MGLDYDFQIGRAVTMIEGTDLTLIATGETVRQAMDAALLLKESNINAEVLNVHSLKPFDVDAVKRSARKTKRVITVEEHSIYNGLGAAVLQALSGEEGIKQKNVAFPDEVLVTGTSEELFHHYGLDSGSLVQTSLSFIGG